MIWLLLAALGVPLWFCAAAIGTLAVRNRKLRVRAGDVPVRRRLAGRSRWGRGHGVWISDVFVFRGSPAAWSESLLWVRTATIRPVADAAEARKLRRLGEGPVIAVLTGDGGERVEFAANAAHAIDLLGPLAAEVAGTPKTARA